MSGYEIASVVIACISLIISISASVAAFMPYFSKIKFEVRINPFVREKEDMDFEFLIINKKEKDLIIDKFYARKGLDFQDFNSNIFPKKIKANSYKKFTISNTDLKFDSFIGSKYLSDKKLKNTENFYFYLIDSVRKSRKCKVKYKYYANALDIFNYGKKALNKQMKESDIKDFMKVLKHLLKNKMI